MAIPGPTGGTGPALPAYTLAEFQPQASLFDEDLELQNFLTHLRNANPDQIRAFVLNNVTSFSDVQQLLVRIMLWLARASSL